MVGYLADEKATAAALRDDWYVTGDIAIVDEDGFIKITDRLSRFSKIGGEMVPHLKVEEAMLRIPGVEARLRHRGARSAARRAAGRLLRRERGDGAAAGVAGAGRVRPAEDLASRRPTDLRRIETLPVLGSGKIDLRAVKALAVAAE